MAKASPTSNDNVLTLLTATLTGAGQSSLPEIFSGRFNLTLGGSWVGNVIVERSFDGGVTFVGCGDDGEVQSFTGPISTSLQSSEEDVFYRVTVVALTSGSVQVRLSQ